MSYITAKVTHIDTFENINIVQFISNEHSLSMMSLSVSDKINLGTKVRLAVKPTHIAIAKNITGSLSYSNQLDSTITDIQNGKLLSSVMLKCNDIDFESIITLNSSIRMNLKVGDNVIALIKASDLSIDEIIDV